MKAESVEDRLLHTISRTLQISEEEIDFSQPRSACPAWDSLRHLEVMMAIEKEFSIRFQTQQLTDYTEPSEILDLVTKMLRKADSAK